MELETPRIGHTSADMTTPYCLTAFRSVPEACCRHSHGETE